MSMDARLGITIHQLVPEHVAHGAGIQAMYQGKRFAIQIQVLFDIIAS